MKRFKAIERQALRKLDMLHAAPDLRSLTSLPGNHLEQLKGDRKRQYSIRINEQWRICFEWGDGDAYQVEMVDYHKEKIMAKKLKPVHPGEILREEFMKPLRLSRNRMALDLRVPVMRIADIVNEKRGITADTALRFACYFRNSPAFWMNLQSRYELEVAEDEIADTVERDVQPLEATDLRS